MNIKIYAEHADGTPALWYDPETQKLNDYNEAQRVASEAEADKLAAEWIAVMASCDQPYKMEVRP